MTNLPKSFDSSESEPKIFEKWEQSGLFNPDNMSTLLEEKGVDVKTPFAITLPPPNANGNLHLGHMCGYSFHDAIGRYMRMTGHPTLLLPGKDHAGIQTETAFTKILREQGVDKWEMGREEFYKQCYDFCMTNASNARSQEKNIGLSADFSREFFTLDDRLTKTIYETFEMMFKDGMVYRDKRIVNICPQCKTALADIDTEHEEMRGIFAYIKYPLVEKEDVSNIKLVLFDIHGVLKIQQEGRVENLRKILKLDSTEEVYTKIFKKIAKLHRETSEDFKSEEFWESISKEYELDEQSLGALQEVFFHAWNINQDLIDSAKKLRERGIKTALFSNGNKDWTNRIFDTKELSEAFDFQYLSGNLSIKGKPYENLYIFVEEDLGLKESEILLIDDSGTNGQTALNRGWNFLHYKEDNDEVTQYLDNGQKYITVATTRPETMLGDTAVAVNPDDPKYQQYIGKNVILPIQNKEIPVIAEEEVDMETGTGALKVTPAHSPVDYEIGKKHDLEIVNVIDEEGHMIGEIPDRFKGMGTNECSRALCKELDEQGLLVKIENIKHDVAVCERCKTPVQPVMSNQWYIDVSSLAQRALEALKSGEVKVMPEGQQRALEYFYENIQPWCVSRQLWWGQRIPVWYKGGKKKYDEDGTDIHIGENAPDDSGEWEAETDMFDTWFSSGQWPYSTLGGPEGEDFGKYYPTQMMIHARDILFWWSARMLMLGLYRTDKVPFNTIFLTGMIMASDGSKMSKSKGNGVEPDEVFEKYGADALRLWYYANALPGSNAPLGEEKIKGNRNFVNKIWNASRFILFNVDESELDAISKCEVDTSLERVLQTREHINKVSGYLDKKQFNLGAEAIREFFWHTLCDVWIEEIKTDIQDEEIGSDIRIQKLSELLYVLKENLKIMHPFIPFVTEAIWQELVGLGLAEGLLMEQQID